MSKFFRLSALALSVMLLFCACADGQTPLSGAEPSEAVVSDGGTAARQGKWIYYINGDNFTRNEGERFHEYSGALCRMLEDGSEKSVVCDKDVSVFNIDGEDIFLCVYENELSYSAKIKVDGTGYQVLKKIDDIYYGGCYGYTNGYIYYTRSFRLYCMDKDGKSNTKLTDFKVYNLRTGEAETYFTRENDGNIGSVYKTVNGSGEYTEVTKEAAYVLNVNNGTAYYYMLGNGTVYEYRDGNHKAVIYGGYTEYAFSDTLYCVSAENEDAEISGIYVIPFGGGQKKRISENYGSRMIIAGDYVYYVNQTKLNYLYRAKLDGSGDEMVSDEYVYDYDTLDYIDGYIYFFSDSDYDRVYRVDTVTLKTECIELEDTDIVG